jgi:large subunit ribosomal protein L21e
LNRVKKNAQLKKEAKEQGKTVDVKRYPVQPRLARYVSTKGNAPTTITPVPYEALV